MRCLSHWTILLARGGRIAKTKKVCLGIGNLFSLENTKVVSFNGLLKLHGITKIYNIFNYFFGNFIDAYNVFFITLSGASDSSHLNGVLVAASKVRKGLWGEKGELPT